MPVVRLTDIIWGGTDGIHHVGMCLHGASVPSEHLQWERDCPLFRLCGIRGSGCWVGRRGGESTDGDSGGVSCITIDSVGLTVERSKRVTLPRGVGI